VTFFLQGVGFGVGTAKNLDTGSMEFNRLPFCRGGTKLALYPDAAAGSQLFDFRVIVNQVACSNNLQISEAGTIIDLDKGKAAGISPGANPTGDGNRFAERLFTQYVQYSPSHLLSIST
jgi:hypothetical protein